MGAHVPVDRLSVLCIHIAVRDRACGSTTPGLDRTVRCVVHSVPDYMRRVTNPAILQRPLLRLLLRTRR